MMDSMRINISILLLTLGCLWGCSQEVLVTQGKSLGEKEVYPAAGDFSVFVETTGVWSVSSPEDWIHVPAGWFRDNHAVIVAYDSNESVVGAPRFNRIGHVIVKTFDGAAADTLYVRQQGIEPYLAMDAEVTVPSSGGSCYIPVYTNLTSAQRGSIICQADAQWISGPALGKDCTGVSFDAAPGSGRSCRLTVTFTDAWGLVARAETIIKQ